MQLRKVAHVTLEAEAEIYGIQGPVDGVSELRRELPTTRSLILRRARARRPTDPRNAVWRQARLGLVCVSTASSQRTKRKSSPKVSWIWLSSKDLALQGGFEKSLMRIQRCHHRKSAQIRAI